MLGVGLRGRSPESLHEGDAANFPWPHYPGFNGISGVIRVQTRPSDVTDGLSNTYFLGEQSFYLECYAGCADFGASPFGPCLDATVAFARFNYMADCSQEGPCAPPGNRFGSAHRTASNFVFGDGSVRAISYTIDLDVHRRLCDRQDGEAIPADSW